LLVAELKKDPLNSRYTYYAGISYLAANQPQLAIDYFLQRVKLTSPDSEELYSALYHLGICYSKLARPNDAICSFLGAVNARPSRAEPFYRMAIIYREQGSPIMGYIVAKHALSLPYPKTDSCVEYQTYSYKLLIEFANCALLDGRWQEGLNTSLSLMANKEVLVEYIPAIERNIALARNKLSVSCRSGSV
jgi:tetratricopeptide (TPR) repeat protein